MSLVASPRFKGQGTGLTRRFGHSSGAWHPLYDYLLLTLFPKQVLASVFYDDFDTLWLRMLCREPPFYFSHSDFIKKIFLILGCYKCKKLYYIKFWNYVFHHNIISFFVVYAMLWTTEIFLCMDVCVCGWMHGFMLCM